jgi:hypothetical protein
MMPQSLSRDSGSGLAFCKLGRTRSAQIDCNRAAHWRSHDLRESGQDVRASRALDGIATLLSGRESDILPFIGRV